MLANPATAKSVRSLPAWGTVPVVTSGPGVPVATDCAMDGVLANVIEVGNDPTVSMITAAQGVFLCRLKVLLRSFGLLGRWSG